MAGGGKFWWLVALVALTGAAVVPVVSAASPPRHLKPVISLLGGSVAGAPTAFKLRVRIPPDERLARYRLDFGDGGPSRKGTRRPGRATHIYAAAGRYRVTFTVIDSGGNRQRARLWIYVDPAAGGIVQQPTPGGAPIPPPAPPPPPPPPYDPPRQLYAGWVELPPGSVEPLVLDENVRITEVDPDSAMPTGITVALAEDQVLVQAAAETETQSTTIGLDAEGCIEEECELPLKIWVPLVVLPLDAPAGWLFEFTAPSPDRVAEGTDLEGGGTMLTDELLVMLGSAEEHGTREEADAIAAAVEGVVSGGLEGLGVFEIRWDSPQDLEARRNQLLALPNVTDVSNSTLGLIESDSVEPPGDWSGDGAPATWPFREVRVGEAWDLTQGSDVTVGIIDEGLVYKKHEDLEVTTSLYGDAQWHATHVAGLACGKANGIGLVGMAWGCPIVTSGIRSIADKHVLEAAEGVAGQWGVRVINMSLGYNVANPVDDRCATAKQQQDKIDLAKDYKPEFRRLFTGAGSGIVWTISAGNNCAAGVPSPWGLNSNLANVITVAATNSNGELASFSDFGAGVEVAAPGGVGIGPNGVDAGPDGNGTIGIWSTWYHAHCWPLGFGCGSYGTEYGTSMAAPIVAGIAALVRSAHPDYTAAAAARCITETVGESTDAVTSSSSLPADGHVPHVTYSPATLQVVDAEAAVKCDTFGPVDDSDYLGKWGYPGYGYEVVSEGDSTIGIINEQDTHYVNGCVDPPGQRIFRDLTRELNGQWSGEGIAIASDCQTRVYHRDAAIRIVRGSSGEPTLVVVWVKGSSGPPPTIEPDGDVISSYEYYEVRMTRQAATAALGGGSGTEAATASAKPDPPKSGFTQAGAGNAVLPGAVLRPPTG